jgi:DNA-binding IclR family transcriptional regulator
MSAGRAVKLDVDSQTEPRNSTVDRALRVLEAFLGDEEALGVLELSRQLDLDKSVIHRILSTLVARRFIEQDPATRRYRVGLRVWELGQRYMSGQLLKDVAERELTRMIAGYPYATAYLGQLDGGDIVVVSTIRGPGPINVYIDPGSRLLAELTTTGHVLLAQLAPAAAERVVTRRRQQGKLERPTNSIESLMDDLAKIRERGYGVARGHYTPGVATIAHAVVSSTGEPLLSLSVDFLVGPETDSLFESIPGELAQCAAEVERVVHSAPEDES